MVFASAAGILVAGLLAVFLNSFDKEARAGVRLEEDGSVVQASLAADDAVRQASDRVGFEVKTPKAIPVDMALTSVSTELGGMVRDQDGKLHDLSHFKLATVQYKTASGDVLAIDQQPPDRSITSAYSSIDSGVAGVTATISQRPQNTSITWDSPTATYVAGYHYEGELSQAEAARLVLDVLKSME